MFATFMAAMQAENAKLASTLESKLNTIKIQGLHQSHKLAGHGLIPYDVIGIFQ